MTGCDGTAPAPAPPEVPDADAPVVLPPAVRGRVAALAADLLGRLPPEEVPASLRAVARFTPAKRARLGAVPLAAALEADAVFRQRVGEGLREAFPELAGAFAAGAPLPAAPPEDLAAVAYVLRPPGWQDRVAQAAAELVDREEAVAGAAGVAAIRRLTRELAALRETARAEAHRQGAEADALRVELLAVRRKVRELGDRAGRAEAGRRAAEAALAAEREALADERAAAHEQLQHARTRLEEADAVLAAGRQAAREGRASDELRLRLLLDALLGAAAGLRRELALAPAEGRPADQLAGAWQRSTVGPAAPGRQGRDPDDPALLDALLALPLVHLLVDGYNVTKGGYGDLPLEAQRGRLLAGLGALAARTGAEVTVVFDGTERVLPVAAPAPRGVRLLFSREGETADEVLRTLVRHEPPGRPVVVVSSDREVAEGVQVRGAHAVPSRALLRLLAR